MKHTISAIFTLLSLLVSNTCFAAESNTYNITAGIFGINDKGSFFVKEHTREIPLITKTTDPTFRFGVIVQSEGAKEFTCKAIVNIPKSDEFTFNKGNDTSQGFKDTVFINEKKNTT